MESNFANFVAVPRPPIHIHPKPPQSPITNPLPLPLNFQLAWRKVRELRRYHHISIYLSRRHNISYHSGPRQMVDTLLKIQGERAHNYLPHSTADMGVSVYEACKATLGLDANASVADHQEQILECIASSNASSIDSFFLIYASSLVFFMQAGFAVSWLPLTCVY